MVPYVLQRVFMNSSISQLTTNPFHRDKLHKLTDFYYTATEMNAYRCSKCEKQKKSLLAGKNVSFGSYLD